MDVYQVLNLMQDKVCTFIKNIKKKKIFNLFLLFIKKAFCCVGALAITDRLDLVDKDLLGWWLAERQLPVGGLNGRPEKLPDVCYSWWVLSSLCIINRDHWIDGDKLASWILKCQVKQILENHN